MIRLREEEFSDIVNYMREAYGINLDKKKVLIECRMTKLLEKRGLNSFGKYLDMLHQDRTGDMAAEMVNCLTTNYTYFYREPDHFRLLQERILPKLMERRQYGGLDIWSAGCAGQINTWEIYGSWRRIFQGMPWIKRRRANIRPRNWKSFHWNGRKNTVRRLMTEPFR